MFYSTMGAIISLLGLLICGSAVGNWAWLMTSRKAWIWVKLFGRNGARIFYFVIGLAVIVYGIYFAIAAPI